MGPICLIALTLCAPISLLADAFDEAEADFHRGKYDRARKAAVAAIEDGEATEFWYVLKMQSELAVGDYRSALETAEQGVTDFRRSIRIRWAAREACLGLNDETTAEGLIHTIDNLFRGASRRYNEPADRIVLGRLLLKQGADARFVLEEVLDPIKEAEPGFVDAYLAAGDLALEKHDYQIAAEEFGRALEIAPGRPDILCRLARALASADRERSTECIQQALEHNPKHVDSLLFLIDQAVDGEAYEDAGDLIDQVLDVHPTHAEALAYRAVIAHLRGDFEAEAAAREAALSTWAMNPGVEHLIGRKLSQKYRFEEGAAYQRLALLYESDFMPAKAQLCQDLLRLGLEEEGWKLAEQVRAADAYHIVAHNLGILKDHLAGFRTLEEDGIVVRMDPFEADIYGQRALDLLRRAKASLTAKYGIELDEPIVVEIFPAQEDFAIRTFGLPGGAGFLGVCFGDVITAQSPAAQGESPSNWEAVLWHEFCHVVTLNMTRNRMPRWLSEGISVYEETQMDPRWGQRMTPAYLELINAGDHVPVSELSAAFLRAPTPMHTQLAYYQSGLAVEWIVKIYGFDVLREVLWDLGAGIPIEETFEKRLAPMSELDTAFDEFVRSRVVAFASQAEWEKPAPAILNNPIALAAWNLRHPESYWGLSRHADNLLADGKREEAVSVLEKLVALCPDCSEEHNAYGRLAEAYRELGDRQAEIKVLREWTRRAADTLHADLRLMALAEEDEDWEAGRDSARRVLAVNPLLKAPHRMLVAAAGHGGSAKDAIPAYRALLQMDPIDPAGLHFGLGRVLRDEGQYDEARRSLLLALDEAPRFRDAHRALLTVIRKMDAPDTAEDPRDEKGDDSG